MEVEYTEDLIIYEKAEHAVIEGGDLIIKCEFQSKFQVKSTTWLFNGKDLEINSKDDKYTSSLDKNSSSLTIHNLKSKDAGTYECVLTNILRLNNSFVARPVNFIAGLHRRLNCVKIIQYFPACTENKRVTIKVHCKYLFNCLMYPFIFICNLPIDVVRHMATGSMLKMLDVDLNSKFAKHLCHLPVHLYFVLVESLTSYGKIRKMILIVIISGYI
jgi:hypothetical protein